MFLKNGLSSYNTGEGQSKLLLMSLNDQVSLGHLLAFLSALVDIPSAIALPNSHLGKSVP